ncbi:MAG TPA: hypothetical protein VG266_05170 [Candidatus Dormibacteraeota bacterium]|jgi:hypothetical protein|nr:hypothetical protein [Candidatus Dormibacteraeota bacterium]
MRPRAVALIGTALLALSACGAGADTGASSTAVTSPTPDPATRPASPATVGIVQPACGSQSTSGTTLHVVVSVVGATIVKTTTTHIVPTEGHVHLYLDDNLTYMNYTLVQDIPVHPGTYKLKAEFVASDHFPFNPRVFSPTLVCTVT